MPPRPHRVCKFPGCKRLNQDISGFCEVHREEGLAREEDRLRAVKRKADAKRGTAHQRGYSEAWRRAREGFLRKHPLCVECLKFGIYMPATVVDHSVPHKGDMDIFWDSSLWVPLCKRHHDAKTRSGR
jgi:5-methylcytosine-specific restriction protein A